MAKKKAAKKKATKKAPAKKPTPKKKVPKKKAPAKKKATSTRARGRPKWVPKFLEELENTRSPTVAAKRAGISRRTPYNLRDDDQAFAEEWEDALEDGVEVLEGSVFEKAKDGWLEPVFYKGVRCGVRNRFSPDLAWKMLQRLKPEIYNLPPFDPVTGATPGGDGSPSVYFYPDPEEAKRNAEAIDAEAEAE